VGKAHKRIDGRLIVTGKARYTRDLRPEGALAGRVLRSPHARAEVVSVDLSGALALPGTRAALRLAGSRVNYVGDQVAAVAAVSAAAADEALARIRVEYRPLPFAVTERQAKQEGAPPVREDQPNVSLINQYSRGDTEAGFAEADAVLERTYTTAVEIHHPAETHSTVADWRGDRLTLWDSTQAIHNVRNGVARELGIPASRVRVIKRYMGGGFGSKLNWSEHNVVAAKLARAAGKPVRLFLSRKENALCVGNRPSTEQRMRGGVKRDGRITALTLANYTCGGLTRGDGVDVPFREVYRSPDCALEEYTVYTNTGPSRPCRAPGVTQGTFGFEGFLDELAAAVDMDPLEFRRRNATTRNLGGSGIPYSSKGLLQCYELGAREIGWERRNPRPGEGAGRIRRGIGMASQIWWGAGVPGTLADIKLYPDGSVEVASGTQDIGCGTRTWMATITADTLGLTPEEVTVKLGDTDYPWAPLSGGSLTTPSVAPAVRDAALRAADRMRELAAGELQVPKESILLEEGRLFSREDPERSVAWKDLAGKLRRETVFHGRRQGLPEGWAYNSFGAHFAEVEVDTETGRIRVVKVAAAHEVGRVINRRTAASQVIGGVTQGVSATLFEERVLDEATGGVVNANLRDYKTTTSMDIPEIVPLFVDLVDPRINNLGTKGLGEPPRIPVSGAIGNAVFNAIGVPVREIPMTPARVLAAITRKEADR
jgi:xanthine dehydrogenase YagR molybdenum-binding subunit